VHIVCNAGQQNLIQILRCFQVQAGKGINISARTFHLAQGDILKVYTLIQSCLLSVCKTDQGLLKRSLFHGWFLRILHHVCIVLLLLQIYDGKDNTAQVLGAFTGSSMLGLTLISTSNHLWLEFYSDAENTGEGFKLVYSSEFIVNLAVHSRFYYHTPASCQIYKLQACILFARK